MVIYPIVLHSSCITKYSYDTKTQLALQSLQSSPAVLHQAGVKAFLVGNEKFKDRPHLTCQNYCFRCLLNFTGCMHSSLPDATRGSTMLVSIATIKAIDTLTRTPTHWSGQYLTHAPDRGLVFERITCFYCCFISTGNHTVSSSIWN